MAGIGFSLKKLFDKKGIVSICRAYGYAGIITTGPMIMGIILLFGVALLSRVGGLPGHQRELLNSLLTYSLLMSLTISSWFNLVVTRYISDMLFQEKKEEIIPAFHGICLIMTGLTCVVYGLFLLVSGIPVTYMILCLWFTVVLIVVWVEMIFLTALKDYQSIVLAFAISLMTGFLVALCMVFVGYATLESLMFSIILAYGMLMCWYYKLMLDYFPKSKEIRFDFLHWFDKYRSLLWTGVLLHVGLFSHLVIMYFGPLRVKITGLFYGAPQHDVPAVFAYFCLLVTTVSFVTSVEVRFYPKYRNYYSLFNDNGSIRDIRQAEDQMLRVLRSELIYLGFKQLITSIFFVVFGSLMLDNLPVSVSETSLGIFRFLCMAYGMYAIANSVMLILLYFEDYTGAFRSVAAFAAVSTVVTILQNIIGNTAYFGVGFFAGCLVFFVMAVLRLNWCTRRLPYLLLSRQSLVYSEKQGRFYQMSEYLEKRSRLHE